MLTYVIISFCYFLHLFEMFINHIFKANHMKKSLYLIATVIGLSAISSCSQMTPAGTETVPGANVRLSQNNYRVLATRVSGEDAGFSLFPGVKAFTKVLTLIPGVKSDDIPAGLVLNAPSEAEALDKLYKASGASQTGRATQLINVRKEVGGWNALIIGRPRIRITGDLIEFTR